MSLYSQRDYRGKIMTIIIIFPCFFVHIIIHALAYWHCTCGQHVRLDSLLLNAESVSKSVAVIRRALIAESFRYNSFVTSSTVYVRAILNLSHHGYSHGCSTVLLLSLLL